MLSPFAWLLLFALPGVAAAGGSGVQAMTVNGVPLSIRVVDVRGTPATVSSRLVARWRRDPGVRWTHREVLPQRTVVAHQRGPLQVSASLSAGRRPNETRVVISVLDPRAPRHPPGPALAVQPARSVWISAVTSGDGIQEYLGYTAMPLPRATQAWIAALRRAGLRVEIAAGGQLEAHGQGQALGVFLRPWNAGTAVVVQQAPR